MKKKKKKLIFNPVYHLKNGKLKIDFLRDLRRNFTPTITNDQVFSSSFNSYADRIYDKYPYMTKKQIAIILLMFVEALREMLILGNIVNVLPIFTKARLVFFKDAKIKEVPTFKIENLTPKRLKWSVEEYIKKLQEKDV